MRMGLPLIALLVVFNRINAAGIPAIASLLTIAVENRR